VGQAFGTHTTHYFSNNLQIKNINSNIEMPQLLNNKVYPWIIAFSSSPPVKPRDSFLMIIGMPAEPDIKNDTEESNILIIVVLSVSPRIFMTNVIRMIKINIGILNTIDNGAVQKNLFILSFIKSPEDNTLSE
jgi:hypothetical protein